MRCIILDIDTLRADHLGCYGYRRNTSPHMDRLAQESVLFSRYYCPNAPCLPSRASLITGLYGIHSGIVGHGGTAADLRLQGSSRSFTDYASENNLFMQFRRAGFYTASFSTFPERHSAWWFNAGLNECHNQGGRGGERADDVVPQVLDWLTRHQDQDQWMLHVHLWDPHTPYRTPAGYLNTFADESPPDHWITPPVFAEHLNHIGPHGANEINMWNDQASPAYPKHPGKLSTAEDATHFVNLYDESVRYTDDHIGQIIGHLRQLGLYDDDLAVILTSDHGEDLGELGIYGEHGVADEPVCRIPLLLRWPGIEPQVHDGFQDNTDLLPTLRDLLNEHTVFGDYRFDGQSFAEAIAAKSGAGRSHVVLTQCAHVCQRSVRFNRYLYMRTIHGGGHLFPSEMLFDLENDPHQQRDIANERPDLCQAGARMLLDWTDEMMRTSGSAVDPLWQVMREGGPEHARGAIRAYGERLKGTPRQWGIDRLKALYPEEFAE